METPFYSGTPSDERGDLVFARASFHVTLLVIIQFTRLGPRQPGVVVSNGIVLYGRSISIQIFWSRPVSNWSYCQKYDQRFRFPHYALLAELGTWTLRWDFSLNENASRSLDWIDCRVNSRQSDSGTLLRRVINKSSCRDVCDCKFYSFNADHAYWEHMRSLTRCCLWKLLLRGHSQPREQPKHMDTAELPGQRVTHMFS